MSSASPELRPEPATTNADDTDADRRRCDAPSIVRARRTQWADLLQRVFEVDALCCPRCGRRMRVLAAITEVDLARRILACLHLPTRAPPPATSPPGGRTRAWPAHEAPGPAETDASWAAFEFDQSTPAEWDVGA